MKGQPLLILMRHGQSIWNEKNLFTGWVDVPLSEKGIQEAKQGGEKIQKVPIEVAFTSTLIRAQMTLFLALLSHSSEKVPVLMHEEKKLKEGSKIYQKGREILPVYFSWRLNERNYGKLQGLNKKATQEKFGEEKVKLWRRSFAIAPPGGESLKDTAQRVLPYFQKKIFPWIQKKKNVFISAHGNSLRALVMYLEKLNPQEILSLEIPTGEPMIYSYQNQAFVKEDANIFR